MAVCSSLFFLKIIRGTSTLQLLRFVFLHFRMTADHVFVPLLRPSVLRQRLLHRTLPCHLTLRVGQLTTTKTVKKYWKIQSSPHFFFSSGSDSNRNQHDSLGNNKSIVDRLPLRAQPYARLIRMDKPVGTMLLLWPCCWSTVMAAASSSNTNPEQIVKLLGLFTAGAFAMRGAGCIINDMWDVSYDKHVERTKTRPLASDELNMTQASLFLGCNLLAGLGVLVSLPHTHYCIQVGISSMPLVIGYPLMKRYTNWPQLVLGMAFSWGTLVGWAAIHGNLNNLEAIMPLYCSGVTWSIVYDTIYAHQDKKDDARLGLKSTALYFGDYTKPILHGFAAMSLFGWSLAGYYAGIGIPIYYAGCTLAWTHLTWQIVTADLNDSSNLAERFKSNQYVGGIVFASIVAGTIGTSTASGCL